MALSLTVAIVVPGGSISRRRVDDGEVKTN